MKNNFVDKEDLKLRVKRILPGIIELRHEFHKFPETRLEEFETAKRIRERIKKTKIELLPPLIGTDTVGVLYGRDSGINVTLRADMDALPIVEQSGAAWQSQRPGFAHSCGHDGHMAILVGVLEVLNDLADKFRGSMRFVFQPSEEQLGGGKIMIEKGLLDSDPKPSAVFALHGWPGIPLGAIATRAGAMMAAADSFTITIKGKGGHGAAPHLAVDTIVAGAQVINGLQTIVSRTVKPVEPAVVSVCAIHGGSTSNVIPERVVMEGTTRYFDPKIKGIIRARMEGVLKGVCESAGATYQLDYREGYIPLVNDPQRVDFARTVVESYLGRNAWAGEIAPTMGSEDFSFYLKKAPGVFLRLGLGEDSPNLHSPLFDFNDQALEGGILVLAALALETLQRG